MHDEVAGEVRHATWCLTWHKLALRERAQRVSVSTALVSTRVGRGWWEQLYVPSAVCSDTGFGGEREHIGRGEKGFGHEMDGGGGGGGGRSGARWLEGRR